MDDIVQNLPFEVVAVPQDVIVTNTSCTMPIKVKIKMKKEDKSIPRQRVISVPRLRLTNPEMTRKVHSDETIMSFNIHMEPRTESKPRHKSQNKFFHLFKTGKCLNIEDDDRDDPPYTLATPVKSSEITSQHLLPGIQNKKLKHKIKIAKDVSKAPDIIFGKCKPGGCLDPPFGEDRYRYYPAIPPKEELKPRKVDHSQKLKREIPNENKEKNQNSKIVVKDSEYNESDASSTYMLYKADPKNEILSEKLSDSIITYPTKSSSEDLSILEKSIVSKKSISIRNRQLKIDRYFSPTKLSKSQERKESASSKKSSSSQKETKNNNLPFLIIPNSERTITLQNSEFEEGNLQSSHEKLVTQSNKTLSHAAEVSGNILLTAGSLTDPIDSLKNKPDEIKTTTDIEKIIDPLNDYDNIIENKELTKRDATVDDVLPLNEINSSLLIPEVSPNLNILQMPNTDIIKTKGDATVDNVIPSNEIDNSLGISEVSPNLNILRMPNTDVVKTIKDATVDDVLPSTEINNSLGIPEVSPKLNILRMPNTDVIKTKRDSVVDDVSTLNEINSFLGISEVSQNLNLLRMSNTDVVKTKGDNIVDNVLPSNEINKSLGISEVSPNLNILRMANKEVVKTKKDATVDDVLPSNEINKSLGIPEVSPNLNTLRMSNTDIGKTKGNVIDDDVLRSNEINNSLGIPEVSPNLNILRMSNTDVVKTKDAIVDDVLPSNEINKSLGISELSPNLNTLRMSNTDVIKTNEEQLLNKNNIEGDQVNDIISNYVEKKETSLMKSNENMPINLNKKEDRKEAEPTFYHSGFTPKSLTQKNIKNYSPADTHAGTTQEMISEMSPRGVEEEKPKLLDLNLPTETSPNSYNAEFDRDNIKSNEQLGAKLPDFANNSDIKIFDMNDDNLRFHENSKMPVNFDQVNASVYSNGSKVYLNEDIKLYKNQKDKFSDSVSQIDKFKEINNEVLKLKETSSATILVTPIDKEKVINNKSTVDITSSNSSHDLNTSSYLSLVRDNLSSHIDNTEQQSNNYLLGDNIIIAAKDVSNIDESTKLNQFLVKEKSISNVNIPDNISNVDVNSTHSEVKMSKTFSDTDITTTEIDASHNLSEIINRNILNLDENNVRDTSNTQNMDKDKEISPIIPQQTLLKASSSSTVFLENKDIESTIYTDEDEPLEVGKTYQRDNIFIDSGNIIAQKIDAENALPELDFPTDNLIDDNISKKSRSIISLENGTDENDLGIPSSKQHITKLSHKLDKNSNLSDMPSIEVSNNVDSLVSSNINSTTKDELDENKPKIKNNRNFAKSKEATDKKENETEDVEGIPYGTVKKKSKASFKTKENIIVDLGFQTYVTENGQTALRTFDPSQEPQRVPKDKIFVKRSVLEINDSKLFPINSNMQLSIKVDKNGGISNDKSLEEELPSGTTEQYKNDKIIRNAGDVEILEESLSSIYKNDLIPIGQLIRNLRIEVDRIAQYGQLVQKKSVTATRKMKTAYPKRCVCSKKWNNYG